MPLEDVRPVTPEVFDELWAKTQDACALFAAVAEDVFSLLNEPQQVEAISSARDWDVRAARIFLDALTAMGLLERGKEGYRNSDIARRCLVPGSADDQTAIIRHRGNSLAGWFDLRGALRRGGAAAKSEGGGGSEEDLRNFICGMENIARKSATLLWDEVDLAGRSAILDLGGGPGTHALEALRRHARMRAAVLDRAPVTEIAREQTEKEGLTHRMTFIPGDLTDGPLPPGYDVHLMSNVVHMLGPREVQGLMVRSAEALEPGGLVIIKDFMPDEDRTGPPFSLRFALHMLVQTPAGDCYTAGELGLWLREAGLVPGEIVELTPQTRVLLAAKPG